MLGDSDAVGPDVGLLGQNEWSVQRKDSSGHADYINQVLLQAAFS